MFIDGARLVLCLPLIQLGRTTAFGHALGSTIIAVGIALALIMPGLRAWADSRSTRAHFLSYNSTGPRSAHFPA
jgi:hypothetical protein